MRLYIGVGEDFYVLERHNNPLDIHFGGAILQIRFQAAPHLQRWDRKQHLIIEVLFFIVFSVIVFTTEARGG